MKTIMFAQGGTQPIATRTWQERKFMTVVRLLGPDDQSLKSAAAQLALHPTYASIPQGAVKHLEFLRQPEKLTWADYSREMPADISKRWKNASERAQIIDEITMVGNLNPKIMRNLLLTANAQEAARLVEHILDVASLSQEPSSRDISILGYALEHGSLELREIVANALQEHGYTGYNRTLNWSQKLAVKELISSLGCLTCSGLILKITEFTHDYYRKFQNSNFKLPSSTSVLTPIFLFCLYFGIEGTISNIRRLKDSMHDYEFFEEAPTIGGKRTPTLVANAHD